MIRKVLAAFLFSVLIGFGIAYAAQTNSTTTNAATLLFDVYQNSCATGGGTTCNATFALNEQYGTTGHFVCRANLYGGTPASGPVLNVWQTSTSGVTVYLTSGVTSTTYNIALECLGGA